MKADLLSRARSALLYNRPNEAVTVLRDIIHAEEAAWRVEVLKNITTAVETPGTTVEFTRDPVLLGVRNGWENFTTGPLTITIRCPR